ncbi:2-hydroxy-acid oxidase [Dactylosporangium vinaceum]|uniref:2-hydroxy-acid oxidase n=1 Tax=Dactylosporangium vinaceum TaxID=53362 RepID=A0ABV5MGD9_9ACTN|nr:2-hydroxy-acid oxidase [Dactylosporangium vinaceum]UAB99046.1 2-hydroxy-acid oxidase [Dactylosporangium vinaceum]
MPWGLRRAESRRFPEPARGAADPAHAALLATYLGDMVGAYGLGAPTGMAGGQSYGEMAAVLLPDEPVDALVLAYDIPDITPGRATATYLSHVCPGRPMAFAVSDQGRAGAHTALRLLHDYARCGLYERSLLIVVEQSVLPYDPAVPVEVPAAHCGVAVLLGPSAVEVSAPRVIAGAEAAEVVDRLGDVTAATVVLGTHLRAFEADIKADRVVLADPGQPMTGVWEALATVDGPVVVADYDRALRYLSISAFGC